MRQRCRYSLPALSLTLLGFVLPVEAAKNRIAGPIDHRHKVALAGSSMPAQARAESDRGRADPALPITYARAVLKPADEQTAALEKFLEEQRDPSSPNYQRWLTPEEFADRFSVTSNDADQVVSWLQSQGFTIDGTARGRGWIVFSGTAGQFETAFGTEIHHFQGRQQMHFANVTPLSVPVAIADVVSEIRGVHNYRWLAPSIRRFGPLAPDYTSSSGRHWVSPDDLARIYNITALYSAGFTGAGQKIAIVGQSDITLSDVTTFRNQFGLPSNPPQLILYGADPGVSSGDDVESEADLEWAGAVARNATVLLVYSKDVTLSAEYAVDNNLAPIISMSYGGCEAQNSSGFRAVIQQHHLSRVFGRLGRSCLRLFRHGRQSRSRREHTGQHSRGNRGRRNGVQ